MASTNNNEQSTVSAPRTLGEDIAKNLNTYAKMGSENDIMKHYQSLICGQQWYTTQEIWDYDIRVQILRTSFPC